MVKCRRGDAASSSGSSRRGVLPYVLFFGAFVALLLHEEARVRSAALQHHGSGDHWGNRQEVAAQDTSSTGHSKNAGDSIGISSIGISGGGHMVGGAHSSSVSSRPGSGGSSTALDAEGLRALRRAALGQPDAAEFAEWAVLQGLLPADQLAEFLNGEARGSSVAATQQQPASDSLRQARVRPTAPENTRPTGDRPSAGAADSTTHSNLQGDDQLTPVQLPPLHSSEQPLACPLPTVDDAKRVARNNTIIFALVNHELLDFGVNWLRHLQNLGANNIWVAVYEDTTAHYLAERHVPCFDARQMIHVDPELGFAWGEDNWNALVWGKVAVANWIMQAGFDLVLSDTDVVWFKDPVAILHEYPQADLLAGTDALQTFLEPGDQGLEDPEPIWSMRTSFNTGVMLWRNTAATRRLMRGWDGLRMHPFSTDGTQHYNSDQDALNDHFLWPGVDAGDRRWFSHDGDRVVWTFNRSVPLGCFPISRFATGHGYSVQRLHKVKQVEPYVLHTTYVYGHQAGKRARLREAGLWLADEPSYFDGHYLTIDLDLPEVPEAHQMYLKTGNMSWELEQQIIFHTAAVEYQLGQLYHGFALAVALNRTFILPQMRCFCDKNWYMTDDQCHTPGAHELRYPYPCPADYLFLPGNAADEPKKWGPPLDYRVASFWDHPSLPAAVKESAKVVRTSRALDCSDCSRQQHGEVKVPAVLDDVAAKAALKQFDDVRVLRFVDAGSAWRGFVDSSLQVAFEKRLKHFAGLWCCRSPEAMEKLQLSQDIQYRIRPLNRTSLQQLEELAREDRQQNKNTSEHIMAPLPITRRMAVPTRAPELGRWDIVSQPPSPPKPHGTQNSVWHQVHRKTGGRFEYETHSEQ